MIQLIEYEWSRDTLRLVFDYMPSDLSQLLQSTVGLHESVIKTYVNMILKGLCYMHHQQVMHRDLKPANILIDAKGILKIADFGLAQRWIEGGEFSHQVATR